MIVKNSVSLGCVEYGNNNFYEIMVDPSGLVCLCYHGDPFTENPDGTFNCEGISIREFALEIKDRHDYEEVMKELCDALKN